MEESSSTDLWLNNIDRAGRVLVFPEDGSDPIEALDTMAAMKTRPTIGWIHRHTILPNSG